MKEWSNTGGTKGFEYSKKDLERIYNEDTESSTDFKAGMKEWRKALAIKREKRKRVLRTALAAGVCLLAIGLAYLAISGLL